MKKRLKSIINKAYAPLIFLLLLLMWQLVSASGGIEAYLLPSPLRIILALAQNLPILAQHILVTLTEAFAGLIIGVALAFIAAVAMDRSRVLYDSLYPLLVISQTIPVVAIAPLLVLWFGYGIMPKIVLIVLICFFPIVIGILDGFKSIDNDAVVLLKAMGASGSQVFRHIKIPSCLGGFFSGLKISVSYAVVGAVIAEWLGGNFGLGVFMTRVRKSYAYDKMFAVIILVSVISLLLVRAVNISEKLAMPWKSSD